MGAAVASCPSGKSEPRPRLRRLSTWNAPLLSSGTVEAVLFQDHVP
jgi:hypothetical protein